MTILVNNAGNHCKKYIEDMTVEDYVGAERTPGGRLCADKGTVSHMKGRGRGRKYPVPEPA